MQAGELCALSAISPIHPSHGPPLHDFIMYLAVSVGAGTAAGVLPFAKCSRTYVGLLLRSIVVAAAVMLVLHSAALNLIEGGEKERSMRLTLELYERQKAHTDGRPRVVVMIPMGKELHPAIERKFQSALKAMQAGNPSLNLTTFIFDKVVPRQEGDDRPLSKVARVRNMMLDEARVSEDFDYVLWIDSDLTSFPPDVPTELIRVNPDGVTAPMVLIEEPAPLGTEQFYDTTAFIRYGRSGLAPHGAQFTCCTSTKVQTLTQKALPDRSPYYEGRNIGRFYPFLHGTPLLRCQPLYFCTSKASNSPLTKCVVAPNPGTSDRTRSPEAAEASGRGTPGTPLLALLVQKYLLN